MRLQTACRLAGVVLVLLVLELGRSSRPAGLHAQALEPATPVTAPSAPADLNGAIQDLKALPGQTSLLVLEDGRELAALNADTPLAVGSSFKLAVLLALRKQIDSGQRSWTDVVPLNGDWRLPGDQIGTWFPGAGLTLQTYAGFMISKSDNTSTDALINTVGRENVEAFTLRNRPLLTTKDLFFFRNLNNRSVLDQYRAADEAGRRAILASIEAKPFDLDNFLSISAPYGLDVEWYFSNRELCNLVAQVADLPVAGITTLYDVDTLENHTPHNNADWVSSAYKGGSEAGVISVTTQVTGKNGRTYCVSATWNDEHATVDNGAFAAIAAGVLSSLRNR